MQALRGENARNAVDSRLKMKPEMYFGKIDQKNIYRVQVAGQQSSNSV